MSSEPDRTDGRVRTNLIGIYMVGMAILLAYTVYALFPERIVTEENGLLWKTSIRFGSTSIRRGRFGWVRWMWKRIPFFMPAWFTRPPKTWTQSYRATGKL